MAASLRSTRVVTSCQTSLTPATEQICATALRSLLKVDLGSEAPGAAVLLHSADWEWADKMADVSL